MKSLGLEELITEATLALEDIRFYLVCAAFDGLAVADARNAVERFSDLADRVNDAARLELKCE